MQTIDWQLFQAINGLAGHSQLPDQFFKLCTQYLAVVLLVLVATLWFTPGESAAVSGRRQRLVVYAVLAAVLALAVNQGIGSLWFRPRPFVQHTVTVLVPHSPDNSFPSDHATGGFALAVVVVLLRDRWARILGCVLIALAALLAFSRVYVGAHYPFDVVTGICVGTAAAVVVTLVSPALDPLVERLLRRRERLTVAIMAAVGLGRWRIAACRAEGDGKQDVA